MPKLNTSTLYTYHMLTICWPYEFHKQAEPQRKKEYPLTKDHMNVAISNAFCTNMKEMRTTVKYGWELGYLNETTQEIITWNIINWINRNKITGFLNQNKSSLGFTWVPIWGPVCSLISRAKEETTCWSFVPTSMTSFDMDKLFKNILLWKDWLDIIARVRIPTMAGIKDSQK